MVAAHRPATEADAIGWLVAEVPELGPLLDQHIRDNGGWLLPYVVFKSDFLRWFIARVRGGDSEPAQRFVAAIEPLMTTDVEPSANDRVWNLAGVCFVEGLQNDRDVVAAARLWMGPNTSKAFEPATGRAVQPGNFDAGRTVGLPTRLHKRRGRRMRHVSKTKQRR